MARVHGVRRVHGPRALTSLRRRGDANVSDLPDGGGTSDVEAAAAAAAADGAGATAGGGCEEGERDDGISVLTAEKYIKFRLVKELGANQQRGVPLISLQL